MKKYLCTKTVLAFKITEIQYIGEERWIFRSDEGDQIIKERAWLKKHSPSLGGYYVVYADGYSSWSPAKAFEEGYTVCQSIK